MIGESGGRTGGNKPRTGARRRFTPEERAARTPITDDPENWADPSETHSYGQLGSLRGWLRDAVGVILLIVGVMLVTADGEWWVTMLGGMLLSLFYSNVRRDRR